MTDDIIDVDPLMGPDVGNIDDPIPHNELDLKIKDSDENYYNINAVNLDDGSEKAEEKKHDNSDDNNKNTSKLRFNSKSNHVSMDPKVIAQQDLIRTRNPSTELELAYHAEMERKDAQIERLTGEVLKLKQFISKRKQVYKRKRKDEGAPTRALSAYNIYVQDRFSRLAKENEEALKSADSDAKLKRVPPASLVASTGNQWKELPAEEKAYYEER
jgi:hypothetical protein